MYVKLNSLEKSQLAKLFILVEIRLWLDNSFKMLHLALFQLI